VRQALWPKLTSLTSLDLSGCINLTDLTLRMVARLATLTELDISGLDEVRRVLFTLFTLGKT
jgi:hypothetical protein